ncbi:hypothetical protein AB6A40_002856 [Gnathostoma spinigerum]|uniref:Uncharacterized protein n=1 Tax=Gnathostoma spinigerum TaxID=75299 RepID=A0ABD6EHV3_9BILA
MLRTLYQESATNNLHRFALDSVIGVKQMHVDHSIAYVESMNEFAKNLPIFLAEKKRLLENLLKRNIHSVIPISFSHLLGMNSIRAFPRARTLVLGFDLNPSPSLFEHFSFLT